MTKKVTTRRDEMRRTTLGVIRAPLRVHCVVTHLLLAHAAILYVTRLSNKTAINRTVHAAHAHISFGYTLLLRLWTPGHIQVFMCRVKGQEEVNFQEKEALRSQLEAYLEERAKLDKVCSLAIVQ